MDPLYSLQDLARCILCETSETTMYCEICYVHLCKDCVEKHSSDSSKVHKVVPLKQYLTTLDYPKCKKHPIKQCKLHCEQCDFPICEQCVSSKKHFWHKQIEILKKQKARKKFYRENCKNQKNLFILYTKELPLTSQCRRLI